MYRQYNVMKALMLWWCAMVLVGVSAAFAAEARGAQAVPFQLALVDTGAENMEGRVLSQKTGQPLVGVAVSLVDAENVVMDVTATDQDGNFNIELDVLDDSGLEAIRLLYLKLEPKKGKPYLIPLKNLIKSFTRTVQLRDISLP